MTRPDAQETPRDHPRTGAAMTTTTYRSGHCQTERHATCRGDYSATGGAECSCPCHPQERATEPGPGPALYHQSTAGIRDALPTPADVAAHPEAAHLHLMWLADEVDRLAAADVARLTDGGMPCRRASEGKGAIREHLIELLVFHQRIDIRGCLCGWSELGASYAAHLADILGPAIHQATAQERATADG